VPLTALCTSDVSASLNADRNRSTNFHDAPQIEKSPPCRGAARSGDFRMHFEFSGHATSRRRIATPLLARMTITLFLARRCRRASALTPSSAIKLPMSVSDRPVSRKGANEPPRDT